MCNPGHRGILLKIADMRKIFTVRPILIGKILLAFSLTANAQIPEIKNSEKDAPVTLQDLRIDIKVMGNIATTTMQMVFSNKSDRVLEGELVFPLPQGASVSRYALDINGSLREAVPVEKEKGQQVFEAIERRSGRSRTVGKKWKPISSVPVSIRYRRAEAERC